MQPPFENNNLALQGEVVDFDALMLLNEYLKQNLNIPVSDYISSLVGLIEDRNFIVEKEDESPDMPDAVAGQEGLNAHEKARLILARIVKTGWADRETMDGSFVEILTPRDYAIRMMQLLDEMRDERIHEYNSLVFSTYSALRQAARRIRFSGKTAPARKGLYENSHEAAPHPLALLCS